MTQQIISQTLKRIETIGHIFCIPFFYRSPKNSLFVHILHKVIFFLIIALYIFSLVDLVTYAFPLPGKNGKVEWKADGYFFYAIAWIVAIAFGLVLYILLNYGLNLLKQKDGFLDQAKEYAVFLECPPERVARWKRNVNLMMGTMIAWIVIGLIVVIIGSTETIKLPADLRRCPYWLSLPYWTCPTIVGASIIVLAMHKFYFCLTFFAHCTLIGMYFEMFCKRIENEKPYRFTRKCLVEYQDDYYRLIGMVDKLDQAFRIACFAQTTAVVASCCLILFVAASIPISWQEMMYLALGTVALIMGFLLVSLPAIRVNNEVEAPKQLFRDWYMKHERYCVQSNETPNPESQQTFLMFAQIILNEDVGVSVASFTKLSGSFLLSLLSALLTYFLIIWEFGTKEEKEASP